MVNKWQFWLLTALAGLVVVLIATSIILYSVNQADKEVLSTRAQLIQQSLQLEPVYKGIIRSLAELAAKDKDEQLRQLLASQGIQYTVTPPAKAQPDSKGIGSGAGPTANHEDPGHE